MGEGRAVFDDQNALALDQFGDGTETRQAISINRGFRVCELDVLADGLDVVHGGGVDLINDDDIGAAEVHFAREIGEFMTRAVRVDDDDFEIGDIKRSVIVAAVPKNDVGFLFGLAEDLLVVHTGIDDRASWMCGSYSSRSSIVHCCRSRSLSVAKRCTACSARFP